MTSPTLSHSKAPAVYSACTAWELQITTLLCDSMNMLARTFWSSTSKLMNQEWTSNGRICDYPDCETNLRSLPHYKHHQIIKVHGIHFWRFSWLTTDKVALGHVNFNCSVWLLVFLNENFCLCCFSLENCFGNRLCLVLETTLGYWFSIRHVHTSSFVDCKAPLSKWTQC